MLCGANSCWSAWDCSQETPLLFGITRHHPVFGGTTEGGNLGDSSDIEKGARDGQRVWCAQALRQSLPQSRNLLLEVRQEHNNNLQESQKDFGIEIEWRKYCESDEYMAVPAVRYTAGILDRGQLMS